MTIGVVQHTTVAKGTGGPWSSAVLSFSAATAGNTLVVFGYNTNSNEQHLHAPAGWTRRTTHGELAASGGLAVFLATKVAAGGETSVTFSVFEHPSTTDAAGSTSQIVLGFVEVNGSWGDWVEDSIAHGGHNYTLPTITPDAGIEALIMAGAVAGNPYDISSSPAAYTLLDDVTASGGTSDRLTQWSRHIATTSGGYSGSLSYVGDLDRFWDVQFWVGPALVPPTAEFTWSADSLTTYFFDESTGDPTSWAWDFGDGATSTSQNPVHIFASAGTYTVCLTATNANGSDSVCHDVHAFDIVIPPTDAGRATVEIYVHDPSGARWDEALWDEATWSTSGWVDVTPQSITASIRWGVSDASKGILSMPDPATWDIEFLDPERFLDPSNPDSPFFGDIVPFLPIRVNHNAWTVKTGVAESIGYYWDPKAALGRGFIRATDNIARLANAKVPEDTTLSDTLVARARDAITAAGLTDIVVLDVLGDDPDLVPWETGTDRSAWDWIKDAAQQVLFQPYIDRDNQLGFRPYAEPLFRDRDVTDADLINLAAIVTYAANYSVVKATEEDGVTVQTRELTPKPRYGARTYERRDPTPNAGDWAQAVLEDRSLTSLRWVPGEAYPLTSQRTRDLISVEAVELIGIFDDHTTPAVAVDGIVLGGLIRLTARSEQSARWWVTFEVAQTAETPLLVSGSDPAEFLLRTGGIEYLYRSL